MGVSSFRNSVVGLCLSALAMGVMLSACGGEADESDDSARETSAAPQSLESMLASINYSFEVSSSETDYKVTIKGPDGLPKLVTSWTNPTSKTGSFTVKTIYPKAGLSFLSRDESCTTTVDPNKITLDAKSLATLKFGSPLSANCTFGETIKKRIGEELQTLLTKFNAYSASLHEKLVSAEVRLNASKKSASLEDDVKEMKDILSKRVGELWTLTCATAAALFTLVIFVSFMAGPAEIELLATVGAIAVGYFGVVCLFVPWFIDAMQELVNDIHNAFEEN